MSGSAPARILISVDFPGAVHAHQRHAVAALDDEVHAREDRRIAVAFRHILELRHDAAAGLGLRKTEVDGLLFGRDLDALDALQFLDAALHLLGLGGLVAEAGDEGFQLRDAVLLVGVSRFELREALGLLLLVAGVAAGVEMHALVPQLQQLAHGHVQEVAVVRDQHEGVRVGFEIPLQPVAGFQVEVIGGLVEQQQVGFFEQQLGQRDAHLPAAGELFGTLGPFALRKSQAGEHHADLRFDGEAVARAELAFGVMEAVGHLRVLGALGVEFGHLVRQRFLLLLEGQQIGEDGHAFGEDGAAGKRETFLREVADAGAFHGDHGAGVQAVHAGQDLQQRGFAGAVGAHDAGALVGRDQPVEVFE